MLESFQTNRITDRLHALAQFVIALLILAAVNYIGMRTYTRTDLTLNKAYSLSAETTAYLEKLDQPVEVIVTLSDQSKDEGILQILRDIKNLLRQYEYATRNNPEGHVNVEYINVYRQTRRAKELGIQEPNVIVFKSGARKRQAYVNELYTLNNNELREFLGESVFTRSILELTDKSEPTIYFTTGHGELSLEDFDPKRGASQFANELKSRNLKARELDLTTVAEVPPDASIVFVAGPVSSFLPEEQERLSTYLKRRSGRVIVLLEPGATHGLDDLLYEWGILADQAIVVERHPNYLISGGDMMVRRFAQHPITDELHKHKIYVVTDRASSVRADPGRPLDDSLEVTDLMETSDQSWGEKRRDNLENATYNPGIDLAGPIRIAALSERKVDSSLGISIPSGKLLVIGTSSFITNNRIRSSGNLFVALNAINFALDRNTRLNIPPKKIEMLKLDISMKQLQLSRYLIWLGPPALVGIMGLTIYLSRRRKLL